MSKLGYESFKFERRNKHFLNPKITSTSFFQNFNNETVYLKIDQVKVVENSL